MGRLLTTAGRVPEAEEVYRRARSLLPSANQAKQGKVTVTQTHLQIFLNLAVLIAANHSRYEEADDVSDILEYNLSRNFRPLPPSSR